ncbi:MAG: hypothetical protein NC181_00970 [Clostridium sp.]|nr:hypothetical protein [Clostridium sp.]MCM1443770.1 hypothetical protein [Candidatus Amulumruptor caecigallinarius]
MVIKFFNLVDQFRNKLINDIEFIYNNFSKSKVDYYISDYFNNIKNQNYFIYTQLVGLLISDNYKILYDKKNFDELDLLDTELFEFFEEIKDNVEIILFIEENPEILGEIINNAIDYNSQDYFTKRKILNSCKNNIEKLKNFSILNIYDYLYYCQKYTPELLKQIFDNALNEGIEKEIIELDLQCTLEELLQFDIDNYYELISELLVGYYIIGKYKINFNKEKLKSLIKTINFLEQSDIINIMDKISYCNDNINNNFIKEILNGFVEFDSNEIIFQCSDEIYKNTLDKLKSITKIKKS